MMHIANTQLWVHDQDEALAFYTDKLGWEVRADHFAFNTIQHDTGTKSFLGETGNFDGDDAARVVLG